MKFGCMELSNLFMVMGGSAMSDPNQGQKKSGHFMKN